MNVSDTDRLLRELLLRTLFQSISGESLARMTELLVPRALSEGQIVFSAGEPSERFFFVLEGKVRLERDGMAPWVFGPRSVIGAIDAFRTRPYTRTAHALADTRLLELGRSDWLDLLEDDALIARQTIQRMAERVHHASRNLPAQAPGALAEPVISTPRPFSTYQKIVILRQAPFLGSAGMQAIASLTALASEHELPIGQRPPDVELRLDRLYIIVMGSVAVDGTNVLVRGPGDLLGGPGVLRDPALAAEARAVAPTVLLGVHEQDYYDLVEEHPQLATAALRYLATELERLLELDPPQE